MSLKIEKKNEGTKDTEESISSSVKILPVSFDSSESNEKTSVFAETRTSTEIINNSGFSELNRMLARRNIIDEEAEKIGRASCRERV